MRYLFFICLNLFHFHTSLSQNFGGNPASVNWKQVNTPTARVIFPAGLDSQANRLANVMELLNGTTAASIGGKQIKWSIILQNQVTIPNAYVRLAPLMSELYMTPSQNSFAAGSLRWDDNLIIHENRHMQQLSNFNKGFTRAFSFFLGQEGQLLANGITIPDYFFEGDAVWQETLVSSQGRGRMPAFYNEFKSLWQAGKNYSWMKLRSGSYKDLTPDHYALGYQVIAYGYEKYGADFWNKVTDDAVRFRKLFYPFNRSIEKHTGVPYRQFRQDALMYFKAKAPVNQPANTFNYITAEQKNNVINYKFAQYIGNDSILVSKNAYRSVHAFYILSAGKETKLRVRDVLLDDQFSYAAGKLVYAAYKSDPRWTNRDHSVIKLYDIKTGVSIQVGRGAKYFSPTLSENGNEILAVNVNPGGTNHLVRIDPESGNTIAKIPNPNNYFFTQTRYINSGTVVSAVRDVEGRMALVRIDLTNGNTESLTPFTYNIVGYPFVKGDTVYFNRMDDHADKIFAVTLPDKRIFRLTDNLNGIYYPAVNNKADLLFSVFTAGGYRLAVQPLASIGWKEIKETVEEKYNERYFNQAAITFPGNGVLTNAGVPVLNKRHAVTKFPKTSGLFNFHSWRPVIDDPEYGYSFFSDNILSSFSNAIGYTYNRSDRSHSVGFSSAFAGWFPVLSLGVEGNFNRTVDTAVGRPVTFNTAELSAAVSIPLRFIGGRTNKYLNFGAGYNIEQFYYREVGKNIFENDAVKYTNAFLAFSNVSQQARQHINPRWAQSISMNYRDAFNYSLHKFVANSSFYFPGLFVNHSLVLNGSFQKRDTTPDFFSKTFAYSRGYEALSTRRMYKFGANYHFPIVYPDWGFANIIFFQRIRGNAFYDHTNAKARVNNVLTEILNRSAGAELFFDTKIWNALPVSFGVRFAHLLDRDLLNPAVKNRWELIIPIGLIPD
jgi:hypothetical protein